MKALLTIIVMLTVAPISAATGLISFDPQNWGGSLSVPNILGTAFFGLITVPLWFTYLPVFILSPMIMANISSHSLFYSMPIWKFIIISIMSGMLLGICILSPCIIAAFFYSFKLVLNWIWAGAFSGAVTLTAISLIYRKMRP